MANPNTIITQNLIGESQGDGRYVLITGSDMTGPLILSSDPTSSLQAATKQYVDSAIGGSGFLPLTGGTMTGNINMNGLQSLTNALGIGSLTGTINAFNSDDITLLSTGNATAPALKFSDNSGIFQASTDSVSIASTNLERARFDASGLTLFNTNLRLNNGVSTFTLGNAGSGNYTYQVPNAVGSARRSMGYNDAGTAGQWIKQSAGLFLSSAGGSINITTGTNNRDIYAKTGSANLLMNQTGTPEFSSGDCVEFINTTGKVGGYFGVAQENTIVFGTQRGAKTLYGFNNYGRFIWSNNTLKWTSTDPNNYSWRANQVQTKRSSGTSAKYGFENLLEPESGSIWVIASPGSNSSGGVANAGLMLYFVRTGAGNVWTIPGTSTFSATGATVTVGMLMCGDTPIVRGGKTLVGSRSMEYVLCGCPYNSFGAANRGGVYVFTRSGPLSAPIFTQQTFIQPFSLTNVYAGNSLAINGDATFLSIGCSQDSNFVAGRCAFYTRAGTTWTNRTTISGTTNAVVTAIADFGASQAFSANGRWLFVGAPGSTTNASLSNGALFMFSVINYNPTGADYVIIQEQGIGSQYFAATTGAGFGYAVACNASGSFVAVSARTENVGGNVNAGSVYIYRRVGNTLVWCDRIPSPQRAANAFFGSQLSMTDDENPYLYVGETYEGSATQDGRVYVFKIGPDGIGIFENTYTPSVPVVNGQFGRSLSTPYDGHTIACGMNTTATGSGSIVF